MTQINQRWLLIFFRSGYLISQSLGNASLRYCTRDDVASKSKFSKVICLFLDFGCVQVIEAAPDPELQIVELRMDSKILLQV